MREGKNQTRHEVAGWVIIVYYAQIIMPVIIGFGAVGIMLLLGPNQCQEGKPEFQN
jgi:hypothetical protein